MPARYDRTTGNYRITCRDCDATADVVATWNSTALNLITGRPVSETFRFHSTRGAWLNRCRECERTRNREQRATRTARPRVPGTTAGVAIGRNRRYGIELELIAPEGVNTGTVQHALIAAGILGWDVRGDGSLSYRGMEVVSPVLQGDEGREQIRKVTKVLRDLGLKPDRSCGFHAHFEIRDLTVDQIKSVVRGWRNQQTLVDGLVSPSRRTPMNAYYCRPLGSGDMAAIERCQTLSDMQTVFGTRHYVDERYRTMNLASYGRYGTVEIRQHQGTCDAEKILTWLDLGFAVIDTAATTGELETTRTGIRDLVAAFGDRIDDTAATFLLGRAVQFNYATV